VTQAANSYSDLSQADLSGLSLKEMTVQQRAELKRRFQTFRQAMAGTPPPAAEAPKKTRKWVPGMKA
jgi:hypothetical protein